MFLKTVLFTVNLSHFTAIFSGGREGRNPPPSPSPVHKSWRGVGAAEIGLEAKARFCAPFEERSVVLNVLACMCLWSHLSAVWLGVA